MLNIFEELENVKNIDNEIVEGSGPIDIGGLLILVGFLIVNIHE